jgi:hypothetical protein
MNLLERLELWVQCQILRWYYRRLPTRHRRILLERARALHQIQAEGRGVNDLPPEPREPLAG